MFEHAETTLVQFWQKKTHFDPENLPSPNF